ncbi:MAG: site-2 protease family protein [Clostridia bacterium]|nr:site-2 protease family protein [Clostridia bacterium]
MPGADRGLFKGKLRIHPLFFAAGIFSAMTGGFLLFAAAVFAALEHECAHAYVARRYGYTLDKLVLMPYGATISGDITGIGRRHELAVLVAGPVCNFLTGVFFVALWWMYPEAYPYTELAATVSFSLFFVNLLPAYPLDGGRILRLLLSPFGEKRARIIGRVLSLLIAGMVLAYFVWSCFYAPAFTALAFAVMLAAGAFGGGSYAKIKFSPRRIEHGVEERRIALSSEVALKDALRFLREDKYLTLLLFESGEFIGELSEEEFLTALGEGKYEEPLKNLVAEGSLEKLCKMKTGG